MWRIFQLNKHLTDDGHPWKKFGTGNRDSLLRAAKAAVHASGSATSSRVPSPSSSSGSSLGGAEDGGPVGREVRKRLIEWWTDEYSANRMRLCVVGKGKSFLIQILDRDLSYRVIEPLNELSQMVTDLFSDIPNDDSAEPLPAISEHPFGEKQKGVSEGYCFFPLTTHLCNRPW